MPLTAEQREQQMQQAEELLFSGPQKMGFAKSLYFGRFNADLMLPYPELSAHERERVEKAEAEVKQFCDEHIDSAQIDRDSRIPDEVIGGLGRLGVMGMTIPEEFGGRGFTQSGYCRIMEIVAGPDNGLGIFVNAHHSIGLRALLLFGSKEQQEYWLPRLADGSELAAFALTEVEAGSDAANVQTTAEPTPDGTGYILNGSKRYITNGGFAKMLTVMARTSVPGSTKTKVTAFIVSPDMPGFEVIEARMDKCGVRGSPTGKLAFKDMFVPKENILGELGKGLKIALTVLDFGRTTFGACCTGAAKICVDASVNYANSRIQFGQPIGDFELVKKKIAYMAAHTFAMESATYHCASLIDRGEEDFMAETAMLKVFASEHLWQIVNDTIQIYGGKAYFTDEPYERMMRDARINQIGEGANDVMRAFIALVGLKEIGETFKDAQDALKSGVSGLGTLWKFGKGRIAARLQRPDVPVRDPSLKDAAQRLGDRIHDFGLAIEKVLRRDREDVLEKQYVQERIAESAIDIYVSSCVISRLDLMLSKAMSPQATKDIATGRYFLALANRRIIQHLAALWDNDDEETTKVADLALANP